MNQEKIFIAVPVFEGQEFISETLQSICDQTFTNYHVLISVDDHDLASAEVCKSFLTDPRFDMVIHTQPLGWARNLNWLIEQCDDPFFIYWQQDDLASTNYLEVLYAELMTHELASIAYTDVQWFGYKTERSSCPSIFGNTKQRISQAIEDISFIPLRGLMRGSLLKQSTGIPLTEHESCHAEFPFLVEMAAFGEFHQAHNALYFKRAHHSNTFIRWSNWQPWKKRRSWIEMGLGFFRVAQQVNPINAFQQLILITILDRLAIFRPGRALFYQPPPHGIEEFVRDFITLGNLLVHRDMLAVLETPELGPLIKPVHMDIKKALHSIERMNVVRGAIGKTLELNNGVNLETSKGTDGLSLLGFGWSVAEAWGVWTDGEKATLLLPINRSGTYTVILEGYHYASQRSNKVKKVSLLWRFQINQPYQRKTLTSGVDVILELKFEYLTSINNDPLTIELQLPDSVFLPNEDIPDHRKVGFGLKKLQIVRNDRKAG